MSLNLFNSRDIDIPPRTSNNFVRSFINELTEHLNNFRTRSIKFGVDNLVGDFAVLENQENGRITEVPIDRMPKDVKQGVILRFENNTFTVDWEATEKSDSKVRDIAERIENRMNNRPNI